MNKINITEAQLYIDAILELVENGKGYTTSDLQGIVTALVASIATDESLLTFEERLSRGK